MVVLVGKSAADNDILTFKVAAQKDFWMHVAGESGSHVVVRNPENLDTLPRETLRYAGVAGSAVLESEERKEGHRARGSSEGCPETAGHAGGEGGFEALQERESRAS